MTRRDDASPTRILLSAALTLILVGLLAFVFRVRAQEQPAPAPTTGDRGQPLAFSHRVHARDLSLIHI